MRDEAALFAAQAAEAFVLKTASSIDDVLWFAKFLQREVAGRRAGTFFLLRDLSPADHAGLLIAKWGRSLDAWVHLHPFL